MEHRDIVPPLLKSVSCGEKRCVRLSGEGLTGSWGEGCVSIFAEGEVLELCRESEHLVNIC